MKTKQMTLLFLLTALAFPVCAAEEETPIRLQVKEQKGINLARAWMKRPISPKRDVNGKVVFQYGATLPTIICAPMKLCDIEFQPGEKIRNVRLGDTVRWKVAPAESGPDQQLVTHALVKPTEARLDTTLVVTTDKRTYHLRLVSRRKDWMPYVAFEYPEEQESAWAEHKQQQAKRGKKALAKVGPSGQELNFAYEVEGKSHWRPVRVFDDGSHTYIDLPRTAKHRDAPILLVKDGKENRLVNYRMHGVRFIVDSLFDEAVLISGVGSKQQKVTIRRKG